MKYKFILEKILARDDLTSEEMSFIMEQMMQDKLNSAQIAAFLVAIQMKGASVLEITAAVQVLRRLMIPVMVQDDHLVDIVGTGGDHAKTFNVSTTSAFVMAAAGAKVAKHGNRSVSSTSGGFDLLEAGGINLNLTPSQIEKMIKEIGIGFMFAPTHHPALKNISAIRRELGIRTIFNLLGPLTNPANAPNLLMGVFSKKWLQPVAEVFQALGQKHVLVVHSEDGLDEISISAPTFVTELKENQISTYTLFPEKLGFQLGSLETLRVENVEQSLALMHSVLNNEPGPARDIVLLNAGAGIYAANLTKDLGAGIQKAREVLESGAAKLKFLEASSYL